MSLLNEKCISEHASVNANIKGMMCNNLFVKNRNWIVDSGVSQHMIGSESQLMDVVDVSKLNIIVYHPNGSTTKIYKFGNINLYDSITLSDVFFIHNFHVNLLSVHKICKGNKCKFVFNEIIVSFRMHCP